MDQSWKQVKITSTHGNQNTQDSIAGQIAGAIDAFINGNSLLLPELIKKQMEEAVSNAVLRYLENDPGTPIPVSGAQTVELAIHLAGQETMHQMNDELSSIQWGFFLVQKRGLQPEAPQLFLDLYLYHE